MSVCARACACACALSAWRSVRTNVRVRVRAHVLVCISISVTETQAAAAPRAPFSSGLNSFRPKRGGAVAVGSVSCPPHGPLPGRPAPPLECGPGVGCRQNPTSRVQWKGRWGGPAVQWRGPGEMIFGPAQRAGPKFLDPPKIGQMPFGGFRQEIAKILFPSFLNELPADG